LYPVVGILFGIYMGGSGDGILAPVHAHINLLGFTLMTVFGIAYRVMPAHVEGMPPKLHFWLHQAGSPGLLIGLTLMITGTVAVTPPSKRWSITSPPAPTRVPTRPRSAARPALR